MLVVDDFLASGSCQEAMFRLVARAGGRAARGPRGPGAGTVDRVGVTPATGASEVYVVGS